MASLAPRVTDDPDEECEVTRRKLDDLPPEVLGGVIWINYHKGESVQQPKTGYYLPDLQDHTLVEPTYKPHAPEPVEFFDNHWYYLDDKNNKWYTAHYFQITHNEQDTGFWPITNPNHPDYQAPSPASASHRESRHSSSEESPQQRFRFTTNYESDKDEDTSIAPPLDPREQSVEDQQQELETRIVTAGIEHVLDITDREPEDPQDPGFPHYLTIVTRAVVQGVQPPSTPPAIQPIPQIVINPPVPVVQPAVQQVVQPVIMAQPPVAVNPSGWTGNPPQLFDGNRA
jgi:hypothetical protein